MLSLYILDTYFDPSSDGNWTVSGNATPSLFISKHDIAKSTFEAGFHGWPNFSQLVTGQGTITVDQTNATVSISIVVRGRLRLTRYTGSLNTNYYDEMTLRVGTTSVTTLSRLTIGVLSQLEHRYLWFVVSHV